MQVPDNDVCSVWVQETFTSYGLCYSFNMMPMGDLLNGVDEWSQDGGYGWKNYSSGWQPDSGYSDDALDNHLPVRTISNSEYYSAKMKLDLHTDDFSRECARGLDAFYILIHSPAEWPDRSHPTLIASVNTLETLSVKPIVITTSKYLISLDPAKRSCYFQNERKLKFFKIYTQKNCILECRSNNMLDKCGCVPFYHLRTKNTLVCGTSKISCWIAASHTSSETCGCLPDCNELYFKLSPAKAKFSQSIQQTGVEGTSLTSSVLLSVFYRHRNYIGFNRIMTSTFGQFIGNVGGIMGLCLGFSFLSLAEIIYFLTLRPLVNFFNNKKKMKKVDPVSVFGKIPTSFTE
uniref:Sodium channel protein Nach n=1 Tax=Sipha flava TaxID=143950 RepID=A0A2S2QDE3_9HEMI